MLDCGSSEQGRIANCGVFRIDKAKAEAQTAVLYMFGMRFCVSREMC